MGACSITEKVGPVWLVTQQGEKTQVTNVPAVLYAGSGRHAGRVRVAELRDRPQGVPHVLGAGRERVEPGAGARPADDGEDTASLDGLQVIWREMPKGGADSSAPQVAFSPDGRYLFLTVGDRQRMTPAQDPEPAAGQDPAPDARRQAGAGQSEGRQDGRGDRRLIAPPRDTELAKTAPVVSTYTFPGPNLAPSETWTTGHRTPYGLAFAPDGRLWELEHGPRGGDELNLTSRARTTAGRWCAYATNYNGVPIPSPDTRPDLAKPVIYWTPSSRREISRSTTVRCFRSGRVRP